MPQAEAAGRRVKSLHQPPTERLSSKCSIGVPAAGAVFQIKLETVPQYVYRRGPERVDVCHGRPDLRSLTCHTLAFCSPIDHRSCRPWTCLTIALPSSPAKFRKVPEGKGVHRTESSRYSIPTDVHSEWMWTCSEHVSMRRRNGFHETM